MRWELASSAFFPAAVACTEGNILGVIANKAFDAPPLVIGIITAAPPVANLSGVLWPTLLRGHDRVRAITLFQLGVIACVGLIALTPQGDVGAYMLAALVLIARILQAGIVNARSDLWRANYGVQVRARVASRISMIAATVIAATGLIVGWAMDFGGFGEHGFRIVFGAAILAGLVGVSLFARIRWRGRSQHLAEERLLKSERAAGVPNAGSMIGVLRSDPAYRDYMLAQFILGFPNIASIPIFIIALEEVFGVDYTVSMLLAQAIPMLMPVLTLPLWAKLLDGMHVIRFRMYHSWFFVVALLLLSLGFEFEMLGLIYASRLIFGIAMGGGMLAWNLGHHDFAKRELAGVYMGIHTALTGLRGATAPLLGTLAFSGFLITLPGGSPAGGVGSGTGGQAGTVIWFAGAGEKTFYIMTAVSIVASLMFARLYVQSSRPSKPKT